MAKATKTTDTVHPDVALIAAYQSAQEAINAYQTRLQAVVGALMAASSQPAPEALTEAKQRINEYLAEQYKSKAALRGVQIGIDLDGYSYKQADIGDVSPEFLELANRELDGKILKDGTEALYSDIVDYVNSARDEDGSYVLLEYQQQNIKHLFFKPAAAPVRTTRKLKEKVDGDSKEANTVKQLATWPGTTVKANITYFMDKGNYMVWGRGKNKLIAELAAVGVTATGAQVDTWAASVGPTLFAK